MVSPNEVETLTRVGPGTPMGALMRQYWIPAAMSSEVEADGPPVRLLLLGEKLVAFRNADGRLGVMDHRCPHRCTSLFFGRNEGDGLRCVYHGWKFAPDGTCMDMPNLPEHQRDYRNRVRAKAYPATERNGLIWVYMGERAEPPALPALPVFDLPDDTLRIFFAQRECNWAQALEGEIDTSHFSFLHYGGVDPDRLDPDHISRFNAVDRAPRFRMKDTDWGTMYGAYRPTGDDGHYWRIAHFLFPFWTMPPDGQFGSRIWARAWVPMDDHHTMFLQVAWKDYAQGLRNYVSGEPIPGLRATLDHLPNTTDWYGRWRLQANEANDYMIDREVQKTESFSGIDGLFLQDQAITESMGPIVDHGWETLVPSDQMIVQTRKRLLDAALALRDDGTIPPGVDNPNTYRAARSGDLIADETEDWLEVYEKRSAALPDITETAGAAE